MKNSLLIIFLFFSIPFYGQDFDKLMVRKSLDCSDVSLNGSQLFERYIKENKQDSARALIGYWQGKCGLREPVYRAKILLSLKQGNFNDSLLTDHVLSYLFNYLNRVDLIKNGNVYAYDQYKSYYGFIPPGQDFDKFTRSLAFELKSKYDTLSTEYLLCQFYSDKSDVIFAKLQNENYSNSVLSVQYRKAVDQNLRLSELHGSIITGVWIPTAGITKLGVHPQLGFQMGMKRNKMSYDLSIIMGFLNTPEYYYARKKGFEAPQLTNYFLNGYVGIDLARDLFSRKGHEISLLGGIGFDGFDTFKDENSNNDKSNASTVASFNLNFGFGYRHYLSNSGYLGLRLKYNMVNYAMNDIIDFTGNPVTIQFVLGGFFNMLKSQNLKNLKYNWRKDN